MRAMMSGPYMSPIPYVPIQVNSHPYSLSLPGYAIMNTFIRKIAEGQTDIIE